MQNALVVSVVAVDLSIPVFFSDMLLFYEMKYEWHVINIWLENWVLVWVAMGKHVRDQQWSVSIVHMPQRFFLWSFLIKRTNKSVCRIFRSFSDKLKFQEMLKLRQIRQKLSTMKWTFFLNILFVYTFQMK